MTIRFDRSGSCRHKIVHSGVVTTVVLSPSNFFENKGWSYSIYRRRGTTSPVGRGRGTLVRGRALTFPCQLSNLIKLGSRSWRRKFCRDRPVSTVSSRHLVYCEYIRREFCDAPEIYLHLASVVWFDRGFVMSQIDLVRPIERCFNSISLGRSNDVQ